ncbi:MAG: hypothetical protein N3D73_00900 [Candidatus Diapherotrites archaeon]|nr:hypothetical protein [Candidatus Diapherotrites archaeon]
MWFVVFIFASLIALSMHILIRDKEKYKTLNLSLMLLGATIMIFVDKLIGFLNNEGFIETTTDGLITNSLLLGFLMLIPIIAVWLMIIVINQKSQTNNKK